MSTKVLVLGRTGTGKSYAMRNLNPDETFYICPDEKELPFQKGSQYKKVRNNDNSLKFKDEDLSMVTNRVDTCNPSTVLKLMDYVNKELPQVKCLVIDTITNMMSDEFLARSEEGGWGKFTDIAKTTYNIMKKGSKLRDDLTVFYNAHSEQREVKGKDQEETRFFVVGGKILKEKIEPESLFSIVLETVATYNDDEDKPEWYFRTYHKGDGVAKTPEGLFDEYLIPNDFKKVKDRLDEYYGT